MLSFFILNTIQHTESSGRMIYNRCGFLHDVTFLFFPPTVADVWVQVRQTLSWGSHGSQVSRQGLGFRAGHDGLNLH